MKKMMMILALCLLSSCVAGEFTEDRNRMHEINRDRDVCEKHPERCINGISW